MPLSRGICKNLLAQNKVRLQRVHFLKSIFNCLDVRMQLKINLLFARRNLCKVILLIIFACRESVSLSDFAVYCFSLISPCITDY